MKRTSLDEVPVERIFHIAVAPGETHELRNVGDAELVVLYFSVKA